MSLRMITEPEEGHHFSILAFPSSKKNKISYTLILGFACLTTAENKYWSGQ